MMTITASISGDAAVGAQRPSVAAHTPTPWRVFTTKDGRRLIGVGGTDGEGVLDAGFGVWAWNDPEGIANAELAVRAVNSYADMLEALQAVKPLMIPGMNWTDETGELVKSLVAAAIARATGAAS